MNKLSGEKLRQVHEVVAFYQGIVLDAVEQEMPDRGRWLALRSRLLRAFGDRGLSNRLREILEAGVES
jgi:hypothetical protein